MLSNKRKNSKKAMSSQRSRSLPVRSQILQYSSSFAMLLVGSYGVGTTETVNLQHALIVASCGAPRSLCCIFSLTIPLDFTLSIAMGFTTALIGGTLGFTAQVMSNSIQKIPLSRRKWNRRTFGLRSFRRCLL
jgi:hypothetical protein